MTSNVPATHQQEDMQYLTNSLNHIRQAKQYDLVG